MTRLLGCFRKLPLGKWGNYFVDYIARAAHNSSSEYNDGNACGVAADSTKIVAPNRCSNCLFRRRLRR